MPSAPSQRAFAPILDAYKCAVLRANIPGYPFPVVMTIIKDNELRAYTREHIVKKPTPSHCILLTNAYDRSDFALWHRRQLNA